MSRKLMGKKTNKYFFLPEFMNYVLFSKNETLFMFGSELDDERKRHCLGVGRVAFIEKGKDMDLVFINFGRAHARRIIVINNHARRQIYTLKSGQLAWVYGYMKIWTNQEGKVQMQMFAKGFQAWYVPKTIDIKNYDLDSLQEMPDNEEKETRDFIENILNGED